MDTSSGIEALRLNGRENIRKRVKLLLIDGPAAWCDMVAVELWDGAREMARKCQSAGHTVPSVDLVIASCALFHGVELEHCDAHFDLLSWISIKNSCDTDLPHFLQILLSFHPQTLNRIRLHRITSILRRNLT